MHHGIPGPFPRGLADHAVRVERHAQFLDRSRNRNAHIPAASPPSQGQTARPRRMPPSSSAGIGFYAHADCSTSITAVSVRV